MYKRLWIMAAALILAAFSPISMIGGNFAGTPEEMESNLSDGAKKLIEQAYIGVKSGELHDHHVHIVGLNKEDGTEVNQKLFNWWRVFDYIKTRVYLSGSGVNDKNHANQQYIERLVSLIRADKNHGKYHILAFDHNYNDDGTVNYASSEFYTSNEYVMNLTKKYPDIFVPVISVHPYRVDAVDELVKWAKQGVHWIKWLPNAQNIDASSPRLNEYYQVMKKYKMVLLTHTGEEQAVHSEAAQKLGNPLLFRRPLDLGVKIVMAHVASLGKDEDLDNPGSKVASFDLFMRLMENPKYKGLLYGEISSMTQFNRMPRPLLTVLERDDLHDRLVNGSDYPLPTINIIIQTKSLVKYKMITEQERQYLNEIYAYNPLLFDYVLKRTLRHPESGKKLNLQIFRNEI